MALRVFFFGKRNKFLVDKFQRSSVKLWVFDRSNHILTSAVKGRNFSDEAKLDKSGLKPRLLSFHFALYLFAALYL